jgi:hypothetical protein
MQLGSQRAGRRIVQPWTEWASVRLGLRPDFLPFLGYAANRVSRRMLQNKVGFAVGSKEGHDIARSSSGRNVCSCAFRRH